MDLLHAMALALIQGITEFLPISSSAHLILPFQILGWPDQGLAFDVAVHLGSLVAVVCYLRRDILQLLGGLLQSIKTRQMNSHAHLALMLLVASLPLIPAGLLLNDLVETQLRSLHVIIATTVGFAILLLLADRMGLREKQTDQLSLRDSLLIGIAQCLALIPGTSRSGVTMTLGLLTGYTREAAARISFLLSIPAITGAAILKTFDLITSTAPADIAALATGFGVSAITAFTCIALFMQVIARLGFLPFVIYRLCLGALLAAFLLL